MICLLLLLAPDRADADAAALAVSHAYYGYTATDAMGDYWVAGCQPGFDTAVAALGASATRYTTLSTWYAAVSARMTQTQRDAVTAALATGNANNVAAYGFLYGSDGANNSYELGITHEADGDAAYAAGDWATAVTDYTQAAADYTDVSEYVNSTVVKLALAKAALDSAQATLMNYPPNGGG